MRQTLRGLNKLTASLNQARLAALKTQWKSNFLKKKCKLKQVFTTNNPQQKAGCEKKKQIKLKVIYHEWSLWCAHFQLQFEYITVDFNIYIR